MKSYLLSVFRQKAKVSKTTRLHGGGFRGCGQIPAAVTVCSSTSSTSTCSSCSSRPRKQLRRCDLLQLRPQLHQQLRIFSIFFNFPLYVLCDVIKVQQQWQTCERESLEKDWHTTTCLTISCLRGISKSGFLLWARGQKRKKREREGYFPAPSHLFLVIILCLALLVFILGLISSSLSVSLIALLGEVFLGRFRFWECLPICANMSQSISKYKKMFWIRSRLKFFNINVKSYNYVKHKFDNRWWHWRWSHAVLEDKVSYI